jgi:uncharacterized protein (TIGR03086 family)
MTSNGMADLTAAMAAVGSVVDGVRDDQWSAGTPCGDWSVQQLTGHLVGGDQLFPAILSGTPMPPLEELRRWAAEDRLGADPSAAYREAAGALLAAFELPGVLDEVHGFPVGPLPGRAAIQLRTVETLVHGWDLATATGQRLPSHADALAEGVLAFSRQLLARLPEGRHPFAPSRPVAGDAPALDRLVALLGREPDAAQMGGRSS